MSVPPDVRVLTADGSVTAWSGHYGQAYSSVHGARTQAETVFVRGSATDRHPCPRVLEVGFGLGHNFRATRAARPSGRPLEYLAYESEPAPQELLSSVSASDDPLWGDPPWDDPLWLALLRSWGEHVKVAHGAASLEVRPEDVTRAQLPRNWATAVYLDGFSPRANPEVWTAEFCARLAEALVPGGVLATYSAAGHVRRALRDVGLAPEKRRGLAGKREFLVAVKP